MKSVDDREYDSNDINSEIEEEEEPSSSDEREVADKEEDESNGEEGNGQGATQEVNSGGEDDADFQRQGTGRARDNAADGDSDEEDAVNSDRDSIAEKGGDSREGGAASRKRSLEDADGNGDEKRQKTSDGDGTGRGTGDDAEEAMEGDDAGTEGDALEGQEHEEQ